MNKSKNIVWHKGDIKPEDREEITGQKGLVLWFTGLSGSGKSTIAVELEKQLIADGRLCYRLDGDNIRHGLNSDLGFSDEDREENIRRIAEVAALFKDAGLLTLVSFIAPSKKMRDFARQKAGEGRFIEVYVKASLDTCIERDPKGLYKKAQQGEIKDFTGISSDYEEPQNPEIVIDTDLMSVDKAVKEIRRKIRTNKKYKITKIHSKK
jgi:adenylyl-sulfate kinase